MNLTFRKAISDLTPDMDNIESFIVIGITKDELIKSTYLAKNMPLLLVVIEQIKYEFLSNSKLVQVDEKTN